MAYSGKFKPKNPKKYKGDPTSIIYRSLLERRFMKFCDEHDSVLEWNYEQVVIPYRSPLDNRIHRYFVDFWVKRLGKDGKPSESIVEIKPHHETQEPVKGKKSKKVFLNECVTWARNQAKWEAAIQFANKKEIEFRIITDKDLSPKR